MLAHRGDTTGRCRCGWSRTRPGEQLRITVEDVEHDSSHELGVDPGLVKDGVEAHLQELLAEHVELLGRGLHPGAP